MGESGCSVDVPQLTFSQNTMTDALPEGGTPGHKVGPIHLKLTVNLSHNISANSLPQNDSNGNGGEARIMSCIVSIVSC